MTDTERILALLQRNGSVTSYELRTMGLSGNPSERIRDLKDLGYDIGSDRTTRVDPHGKKRPMAIYTLRSGESEGRSAESGGPRKTGMAVTCSLPDGAVTHSSVTGRDMEPGFSPPEGAPDQAQQDTEPVGRVSSALPTDPLPAFDGSQVEHESASVAVKCGSYYDIEAELEWEAA